MADGEDDPYAVSSDSEDEAPKGPPPKINIEGRTVTDLSSLKAAFTEETKEAVKDEARLEELNELASKQDIKKLKKEFLEGKTSKDDEEKTDESKEPITVIPKETYSKFKEKFEKMPETLEQNLEEKLKAAEKEKELAWLGKEILKNIKGAFENPRDAEIEKEKIVVERSEADKKRILSAFVNPEMTADEAPRECAVCSKIVYPVERIFANKCLYHNTCFKCSQCSKKLTPTNYNMHEAKLLCKVHYLEVFHPEIAKTMDPHTTEEDERMEEDEEDFAISSKPKRLGADVVRSGAKVEDELANLGSLKARKGDWESSAKEAATVEKKSQVEVEGELIAGKVKSNLERFVKGEVEGEEGEEDKRKPLEDLNLEEIGNIKNKWKTGNVEGVEKKEMSNEELEELKKGPRVKERFRERTEAEENVAKQWDRSELDTSAVADARRSFLEGSAFQSGPVERTAEMSEIDFKRLQEFKERFEKGEESGPVEKTAIDITPEALEHIKAAFEKGTTDEEDMTPEERAERKKKEIEAEFLRYKLARRAAAQRAAAEKAEEGETGEAPAEEIPAAEVGSIKDRFEKGEAFKSAHEEKQLDVEIKMAGKAREKFKQIDAEGPQMVSPTPKEKHESKWDKKATAAPEVINRRVVDEEPEEPEDEDAFDVKNLMNKFKNIESEPSKALAHDKPIDLGVKVEARNLKEQFEKAGTQADETAEEKRKGLEEEFARLKEEKEAARAAREETPEEAAAPQKEEVQIAADHASKMAAKWEKIQKKEAKKAERGKMPQRTAAQAVWWARMTAPPMCDACKRGVYIAERFECFSQLYHQKCFRCKHCKSPLRAENCQRSSAGDLFCETHYRRLFVPQSSFVFRSKQRFVASG